MKTNDVIGIGNALMDFLIEVEDNKLLEMNLNKGEFHLVEENEAKQYLEKIKEHKMEIVPGGSVANTLRGLGLLGSKVILCGKVGNDPHGEMYEEKIKEHNVSSRLKKYHATTGHALTFITPDSERTFSVHLGAAIEIEKEDILEEDIKDSKILHLEGYQFEGKTKEVVLHAMELAKKHNTLISLDLADPGVIRRNKEFFLSIIKKVDILFVNETEAKEFTGKDEVDALTDLAEHCKIAIVKLGKNGSIISNEGEISMIDPFTANPVDTTGAGDTFAAGFLYGYCNGWDIQRSGKLGSLLASKIIEQKGVKLDQIKIDTLKELV
ncbi:adenosine kinase [Candidatus Woesearchaeota archaeon CG10_big_fil_rev_8_21_14_0_10_45_16]|nr:MAG: adenosine kinase [Candidatus Woesearchaeota archaeon CG10_big_fil_rev_8_21_14_0_10_45_16]